MELNLLQIVAVYALPVIFAITLHEAAHGYVARHFGDMTAAREGRVTLNPLRHIIMVLNLVPLPPLDGGRILVSLLPLRLARAVDRVEPYGFFILIVLLLTGVLGCVLWPAIAALMAVVAGLLGVPVRDLVRLTGLA